MGCESDASELQETPLHSRTVHLSMCARLWGLVDRISNIHRDIEATRPGSGIPALSKLWYDIESARKLVQSCCQSSNLYLAITGDRVVARFERKRNQLEQRLSQLQSMVPVELELKISEILDNLRDAMFSMDSNVAVAGKALQAQVLRALLQQDSSPLDSDGSSEIKVLQSAAPMLHLTLQNDLLIERGCLMKLLNEVKEGDSTKRKTLSYLLYLLSKYDKLIVQGQTRNPSTQHDESRLSTKANIKAVTNESNDLDSHPGCAQDEASAINLHMPIPPEEFKCPLSARLMYDPVTISSGETFERMYIQKWFSDGHDTCPKTSTKLTELSIIPNTCMRDKILKWSMEHEIKASDPSIQASIFGSLETSSNSISGTASSMKDIYLPISMSNISLGSLDISNSNSSYAELENCFGSIGELSAVDAHRFQFYHSIDDIRTRFLYNVNGLSWELQCRAIQDVNMYLISYNPSCAFFSSENFLNPLVQFLQDALKKHDGEAQKSGSGLFLTFLSRREPTDINEHVYSLLASFLETEAAAETLAIVEALSTQVNDVSKFAASGMMTSIIKILDTRNTEFQEAAIRILYNLSSRIDSSSCKLASDWLPKLVPFMGQTSLVGPCIGILENLCKFEETKVYIAETKGCIASIIKLLEIGTAKEQEDAFAILLSLCAQREYYCHLVLHEDGMSALSHVSANGNDKGKVLALELLRLLEDTKHEEDEQECPGSNCDIFKGSMVNSKKSSRTSGSIGAKMKMLLKKR